MYGNSTLPGIAVSDTYRYEGSIWRGYPEATWFKTVKVNGASAEASKIEQGTIMKELLADGTFTPIEESDIISAVADLPGARLGIVADKTATTGTTTTVESETVVTPSSVLIGIQGQVDMNKLLIGEKKFSDLTDEQKICLNTQLEAWGFQLINVIQA